MNPVNPVTYHLVKAEEAHRLARIERRAQAMSAHHVDEPHGPQDAHVSPVRHQRVLRTAGAAIATIVLTLGVLVGGALANDHAGSGGGGGGGATRLSIE